MNATEKTSQGRKRFGLFSKRSFGTAAGSRGRRRGRHPGRDRLEAAGVGDAETVSVITSASVDISGKPTEHGHGSYKPM